MKSVTDEYFRQVIEAASDEYMVALAEAINNESSTKRQIFHELAGDRFATMRYRLADDEAMYFRVGKVYLHEETDDLLRCVCINEKYTVFRWLNSDEMKIVTTDAGLISDSDHLLENE